MDLIHLIIFTMHLNLFQTIEFTWKRHILFLPYFTVSSLDPLFRGRVIPKHKITQSFMWGFLPYNVCKFD